MNEVLKKLFLVLFVIAVSAFNNSIVMAESLGDAVNAGDIEKVKLLIEKGENVNSKDSFGRPLLNAAAAHNHINILELLISKGANTNGRDQDGCTPLHTAAFWASKEISVILISKGAEINSRDKFGLTPLHAAAGGCYSKDYDMNVTLAAMAAGMSFDENMAKNFKDISELLISKGADVNAKGKDGYTPLHWAAQFGREGVAELLVSKGADVNSRAKGSFFRKGKTPSQMAADNGHTAIVELLKTHGAK